LFDVIGFVIDGADDPRSRVKRAHALERRVLVVAVDCAMSDAAISAIFEILNKVRGEEAFSDAAFAVDDEVDLFVHKKLR
jgi:hypothetical protein